MKSILTLLFVLTLGACALANTGKQDVKDGLIQIDIVMVLGSYGTINAKTTETTEDKKIARLYRRENTLVKKALRFSTKRNRAKLA